MLQIYGFELSSNGQYLRELLLRSFGYDPRTAFDLASEITPTQQEVGEQGGAVLGL